MDKGKQGWWVVVAGVMAAAQVLPGFGMVEDDGGLCTDSLFFWR